MSVVDKLLNFLVRYLHKKQKTRKRRKKAKPRRPQKSRKRKKSGPKRKSPRTVKRKKTATKTRKKVPAAKSPSKEPCVGKVTHYFSRIQVIVLKMVKGKLCVGDRIHIQGRKTDFVQTVKSLQIESVDVKAARKGQLVGLKVVKRAKVGDKVFLSSK